MQVMRNTIQYMHFYKAGCFKYIEKNQNNRTQQGNSERDKKNPTMTEYMEMAAL